MLIENKLVSSESIRRKCRKLCLLVLKNIFGVMQGLDTSPRNDKFTSDGRVTSSFSGRPVSMYGKIERGQADAIDPKACTLPPNFSPGSQVHHSLYWNDLWTSPFQGFALGSLSLEPARAFPSTYHVFPKKRKMKMWYCIENAVVTCFPGFIGCCCMYLSF